MSAHTRIGPAEDMPQGPVTYAVGAGTYAVGPVTDAVGAGIAAFTEQREPSFEEG
ncbi:MAG: hypothetical protein V3T22_08365 [Planctomycetota bacterium]